MAQNKSLSTQEVSDILHVSKSTIYDLIKRGEINSYKIGRKVRFTQDDVDAYIARSRHEQSTPPVRRIEAESSLLSHHRDEMPELIISGQDVVLDILANHLQQNGVNAVRCYLSSFEGLLSLYEGKVGAAACHLYSAEDGSFNAPFVRALVPGVSTVLLNISYRTQGFYVRRGNPKHISDWKDLERRDITILNRRVGSGARILLDGQLKRLGIAPTNVSGYDREMRSHLTMAAAIAGGEADVGIGTARISRQIDGIDFVPLLEERYDLVLRRELLDTPQGQTLMNVLGSAAFRKDISRFSGNDYRDLGRIIAEL